MRLTRRSLIAALPLAAACSAAGRAQVLYVAPEGEGDGGSWESAASLLDLDNVLANLVAGGEVLIAADRGPYRLEAPIEISRGARPDRPTRIRGVNSAMGDAQAAVLRGTRGDGEVGSDAFRLMRGANNLYFSHFAFERFGNGCFRVGAPISGLIVEDCAFEDVYRFIENTVSSDERHASMRGFAVRRCVGVGVERGFARIRYASSEGVIEDCAARGVAHDGGEIPSGCALDDEAHDIVFRRCVMEGFQQWRAGAYWNGDGFSDEWNNYGIIYEACEARGATDGGFDCKSSNVVLRDCLAEDNKRNFRIWSEDATLTGCISRNPNFRGEAQENASPCHIWLGHEEGLVHIDQLMIEDPAAMPIIEFEHADGRAEIRGVDVRAPRENWGAHGEQIEIVSR